MNCLLKNSIKNRNLTKKKIPKSNLTKNEADALQQLSQRDDTIITKADKGGTVVIIDVNGYIREANRQLDNTDFDKKIPNDPTESNRNKVNNTINEFKLQMLLNDTTEKKSSNLRSKNTKFLYATENPQTRQSR